MVVYATNIYRIDILLWDTIKFYFNIEYKA